MFSTSMNKLKSNFMASSNPFKQKPPVSKPNRNRFDLSFASNGSFKFGRLYPVFCKEVLPGDTFKIKPTFGFSFMPMKFPVQSRVRADLHFFYVRNRNLWSEWKKFIGQTDTSVVHPYLKINPNETERLATGSLADYLGVPTTVISESKFTQSFMTASSDWASQQTYNVDEYGELQSLGMLPQITYQTSSEGVAYYDTYVDFSKLLGNTDNLSAWFNPQTNDTPNHLRKHYRTTQSTCKATIVTTPLRGRITRETTIDINMSGVNTEQNSLVNFAIFERKRRVADNPQSGDVLTFFCASTNFDPERPIGIAEVVKRYSSSTDTNDTEVLYKIFERMSDSEVVTKDFYFVLFFDKSITDTPGKQVPSQVTLNNLSALDEQEAVDFTNPFVDYGSGPAVQLSALPFRAYQSCYNGFYRNIIVNPFIKDGKPEYDIFVDTQDGGEDSTKYDFYNRNWEFDYLTSSVPTPQQGIAPLLGARINNPEHNLIQLSSSLEGEPVNYYVDTDTKNTLVGIVGYDKDAPESSIKALEEAISFGISINDLRNVNSLQRWLEKNIMRGYRYKDQMLSHFGVKLTYEECSMPEFLGGFSQDVKVSPIFQNSETELQPLGAKAGTAYVGGTSKHRIDRYCDEHGFIIGILSFVPIPAYSQLLPKMFSRSSALDYYSPEFGKIGLQPITHVEVCPLQKYVESENPNPKVLHDVFGYQRAWNEYLASVDELHGDFRTTLKDFVLTRIFGSTPSLGKEFVEISNDSLNNIFNVDDVDSGSDKIIGQLYFNVDAIRPIPKYGLPRLE